MIKLWSHVVKGNGHSMAKYGRTAVLANKSVLPLFILQELVEIKHEY